MTAADIHLLVYPRDPALRTVRRRIVAAVITASGDYDVRGLPDGDYLVAVLAELPTGDHFSPAFPAQP